jgi:dephospho-CoA kinase
MLNILLKKDSMIKVAVTGGIGSGKSVVCEVFEKIGIPVFYADKFAQKIMDSDNNIKEKLISYFGNDIFDSNEKLLRGKFAEIIFNNKTSLLIVNRIVHPAVRKVFEEWVKKQITPYVIEETAIVFESGQEYLFDKIISVTAPLELRIERVMKRDKTNRDKVLERLKNQYTDEKRIEKSDFIIVNDDKEMILPQIINIHSKLL